jgi:hypothetical protein
MAIGTFGNQLIAVKLGAVSDQAECLNVLPSRGSPLSGKRCFHPGVCAPALGLCGGNQQ